MVEEHHARRGPAAVNSGPSGGGTIFSRQGGGGARVGKVKLKRPTGGAGAILLAASVSSGKNFPGEVLLRLRQRPGAGGEQEEGGEDGRGGIGGTLAGSGAGERGGVHMWTVSQVVGIGGKITGGRHAAVNDFGGALAGV